MAKVTFRFRTRGRSGEYSSEASPDRTIETDVIPRKGCEVRVGGDSGEVLHVRYHYQLDGTANVIVTVRVL